ncbi:MAG: FixH family protein [Cyclobacteriaceae bacterium]|nr:FixH family protein [Cyclobacteriaceae bacterium]
MNWGWKIALAYSAFVALTLFMVINSMNHEVNLVADDYYRQDLEYQQQIDRIKNTRRLSQPLHIALKGKVLSLQMPEDIDPRQVEGVVHMFRPSDFKMDRTIPLQLKEDRSQVIALDDYAGGLWKVKVTWKSNGMEYFKEDNIVLR